MRTLVTFIVALGLMGWGSSSFGVEEVKTPSSPQQAEKSATFRSGTQNFETRDQTPRVSTDMRTERFVTPERGVQVEKRDTFVTKDRWDSANFTVKLREVMREDPALLSFAEKVDAIQCGDRVILFGVVDSQQVKLNIENKLKGASGFAIVDNKIMVL